MNIRKQKRKKEEELNKKKKVKPNRDLKEIFIQIGSSELPILVNSKVRNALKNCGVLKYIKIKSDRVVVKKQFFEESVQNVYRFSVRKTGGKLTLYEFVNPILILKKSKYNDRLINTEENLKSIVIILESPHENEYDYSGKSFRPIAPAQGNTGRYLYERIIEILELIEQNESILKEDEEYRIIIANPIPCQTSLHYLHRQGIKSIYKILRNKVWKTLWENDKRYQRDFKKILEKLKPHIIINGCTSDLKDYVQEFIYNLNDAPIFSVYHPSSWWKSYNLQRIK